MSTVVLMSLVVSFVGLFPLSPAKAVDSIPLVSSTTTLSHPVFSMNWDTDPSYTNVKYSWALAQNIVAPSDDTCVTTNTGTCLLFHVDLQDTTPIADHLGQEWMGTLSVGDIIWDGPANSSISHVQRVDNDGNGRFEGLEVNVGCSAACTFATSTVYSVTIVNSPLKNPEGAGVPGAYSTLTQWIGVQDGTDFPPNAPENLTSLVTIGQGLTVMANVDPVLSFSVSAEGQTALKGADTSDITPTDADTCNFSTLTPATPHICAFGLHIATNASNGYSIYVVQDHNMTFNGNDIKQFSSGSIVGHPGAAWVAPTVGQLAHLGYWSSDTSVFNDQHTDAYWAGIPNIAAAGEAPVTDGLVADSTIPESHNYTYAIKIESAATLPQGTGYTHHEYFMVVGNF